MSDKKAACIVLSTTTIKYSIKISVKKIVRVIVTLHPMILSCSCITKWCQLAPRGSCSAPARSCWRSGRRGGSGWRRPGSRRRSSACTPPPTSPCARRCSSRPCASSFPRGILGPSPEYEVFLYQDKLHQKMVITFAKSCLKEQTD